MNEQTRAYIYRIALAIGAVLVGYGVISETEAAQWAVLAAAVLGLGTEGLAVANTKPVKPMPDGHGFDDTGDV